MTKVRCSTAIVQALEALGTDIVFGYNGHGNWALLDSFEYESDIKGVVCRTEDQAVHLADGYFRSRPKKPIPVVTTSVGPGNMNIAPALANAFFESSAMIVLAGGGPTHWMDRGGIEEFYRYGPDEWIQSVKTYTKKALMITRPDTAVDMIVRAYKEATTGRPGPVVIQIPFDIQHSDVTAPDLDVVRLMGAVRAPGPDPDGIREAADLIAAARRPLIFAANGVHNADAFAELAALADEFDIPVATTTMGKGAYPENGKRSIGVIGRSGARNANKAGGECDLLVAVGTHFSDIDTGGWSVFDIPGKTKLIHIEIDSTEIARVYPTDVGLHANPKIALSALLTELKSRKDAKPDRAGWWKDLEDWRAEWKKEAADWTAPKTPITYGNLCSEVGRLINERWPDASIAVDTGHLLSFAPAFIEVRKPNFHHCGFFHRMGWSLPAGLGAKFARPDQPAFVLMGDGSYVFANTTLATAYEYDMPVIVVIVNNGTLQIERELMERKYGRHAFVDYVRTGNKEMWGPDYGKIAEAMEALSFRVTKPEEIEEALTAAVASGRSAVLDVVVDSRAPGYRSVWYPYPGDFWKSRDELSKEF